LIYIDNVNLLDKNLSTTIKKHTEALLYTSKGVHIEVSTERTKYMLSTICGSHGSEYEDDCLLGCSAV
jgi:hypothetical protein